MKIEVFFFDPSAGMAPFVVLRATVVDVLTWSAFRLLGLDLTCDFVITEPAVDQVPNKCDRVCDLLTATE